MKKCPRAAALVGLVVPLGLLACLNISGTSLTGGSKRQNYKTLAHVQVLREMMAEQPVTALRNLDFVKPTDASGIEELRAVEAVVAGRLDEGISLLQALEEKDPGRYGTASNLGTAYELKGDNRQALQWIFEGIRRNPESHQGSEWLHALILETKLKLEQDPGWLASHRVLELDETRLDDPKALFLVGGQERMSRDIGTALQHQLGERMLLVKPKDAIVADLLYSYSVLEAHTDVVEPALELTSMAKEYGFAVPELLAAQEKKFHRAILPAHIHHYEIWVGGIAIALAVIFNAIRRDGLFGYTLFRSTSAKSSR
jgi:tetratricopeptide (TPR) repeat protein